MGIAMSIGWRRAGQRCRRRRNAGADGSTVDTVTFLKRRYRHRHAIGLFDLVAGFQFVGDRRRTRRHAHHLHNSVASNTTVIGGGFGVGSGGTAIETTVSGGMFGVGSGAVASATTVVSGGVEVVYSGALAGDTTVGAGGEEAIGTGGSASVTVLSGGTLALNGTDVTADTTPIAIGGSGNGHHKV